MPSKGMAIRGHISGRGPRSGKDERQRTFRSAHETGAAITSLALIPPSKAEPLFYESRVSCRDLRPPLEIHGSGDSKLQSPAEFSDSDGGGDGGIQGLGAAVISWIWGNVKSVGHQFGYLIGNAVGLVADDDDGRGV